MISNQVIDFVKHIDASNRHIISFAEEPEDSLAIQLEFARNALERLERVVFIAHGSGEVERIRNELMMSPPSSLGIGTDDGNDAGRVEQLVDFVIIQNPLDNPEGVRGAFLQAKEMIFSCFSKSPTTNNIVGVMIPQLKDKRRADAQLSIERMWDAISEPFDGRAFCTYVVESIEDSRKDEWFAALLRLHHSVIYLPKDYANVALDLPKRLSQRDRNIDKIVARILAVVEASGPEGATRLKIMGEAFLQYKTATSLLPIVANAGLINCGKDGAAYKITNEGAEWLRLYNMNEKRKQNH